VTRLPRLALVHDHPPGWPGGGPVLLRRLFEGYPSDSLVYLSAFPSQDQSSTEWVDAAVALSPVRGNLGRYGLGRLRLLGRCLPWSSAVRWFRHSYEQYGIEVVHVVSHEFLWIPALLAARQLGLPVVLSINDHWPSIVRAQMPMPISRTAFGRLARRSAAIMGAHEGVADLLWSEYGLHMAGVERDGMTEAELREDAHRASRSPQIRSDGPLRVGYCGMYITYRREFARLREALGIYRSQTGRAAILVAAVEQGLDALLHDGWEPEELDWHAWTDYESVQALMFTCDVLFLPMSYARGKQDLMRWGMPLKTAQYLRAGVPVLVHAPRYASVAGLLREYRVGECVEEASADALCRALRAMTEDQGLQVSMRVEAQRCIRERYNLDLIRSAVWRVVTEARCHKDYA